MGHYEIHELKEIESLSQEYAIKFGLDIRELLQEFEKQIQIGEKLIKHNRNIFQKIREYCIKPKNTVSFREICLSTLIWGHEFHVQIGDESMVRFLSRFRSENPKSYRILLDHASTFSLLSQTIQELDNISKAHLFLQKSTPRSMLFKRKC